MKISVIVPIYNVDTYLKRCLDSLLNQNYKDYEIILIDDGSTDESGKIAEGYAREHKNIRYYRRWHSGVAHARNEGLLKATGEYVYFCDPDDYITGEFFQSIDSNSRECPELLIYGYYDENEQNGKIVQSNSRQLMATEHLTQDEFRNRFSQLYQDTFLYTLWNKVYQRQFLMTHDILFDVVDSGEDVRFNLTLYDKLSHVVLVDEMYYHYIVSRIQSLSNSYTEQSFKYKLEELFLLEETLKRMDRFDQPLVDKIRNDIFIASVNKIVISELSFLDKKKAMKEVARHPEFETLKKSYGLMNRIAIFLCQNGMEGLYIKLYQRHYRKKYHVEGR